jgi:cell division protein FtsB
MLRKANNDYKKIVDEAATSMTTNQQQQQDNSAALVQEIDQLRNEIELLKQQVSGTRFLNACDYNVSITERRSDSTSN